MAKSLEAALQETDDISIPDEIVNASADEIVSRTKLIDNEIKMLKNEYTRYATLLLHLGLLHSLASKVVARDCGPEREDKGE